MYSLYTVKNGSNVDSIRHRAETRLRNGGGVILGRVKGRL